MKESKIVINHDVFAILACPECKSDLKHSKDKKKLLCAGCGREYRIKDGIPILLV
jgi:uncharacterized protein